MVDIRVRGGNGEGVVEKVRSGRVGVVVIKEAMRARKRKGLLMSTYELEFREREEGVDRFTAKSK